MNFMVKIAVLGDAESVKSFAAAGLDIFPCDDDSVAHEKFKKIADSGYGVIYVTEHLADILSEEIAVTDKKISPAVVPIPGVVGNTGIGMARLKAAVEKAVGSDIIFNKE